MMDQTQLQYTCNRVATEILRLRYDSPYGIFADTLINRLVNDPTVGKAILAEAKRRVRFVQRANVTTAFYEIA